jgi:Uma2 family endonuclease
MSTVASQIPPGPSPDPVFRLSVQQYHAMIQGGVLTDDDPVELVEGILLFKMPKNPPHRVVVKVTQQTIEQMLPHGWHYLAQEPITLDDGEPEPDGAVVRGQVRDFLKRHPGPQDVPLVIEVADTTLARDRGIKMRSYARAGIAQYWIINLVERAVEVYARPDPTAKEPTYLDRAIVRETDSLDLVLDGRSIGPIPTRALLP